MSAKLQQEREDTLQLYEKLVKECNHLLENDHKKKKRDQQVETA